MLKVLNFSSFFHFSYLFSTKFLANYEALSKYGTDLVEAAASGKLDPVIGRDDEIRRVIRILSRRRKNNPVLIGDPGVGKTAIVEGIAQRIVRGDIPTNLKCRIISLDMGALIAGMSSFHFFFWSLFFVCFIPL